MKSVAEIPEDVPIQWVELEGNLCSAYAPPVREGGAAQKATVFPQREPLLELAETLMLGDTSCRVWRQSFAAVRAAADANFWAAGHGASGAQRRWVPLGGPGQGGLNRGPRTNEVPLLFPSCRSDRLRCIGTGSTAGSHHGLHGVR